MYVVHQYVARDQDLTKNIEDGNCVQLLQQKHLLGFVPWFILFVSFVQVILFTLGHQDVYQLLLYSYKHQKDIWRYISYMLLHSDAIHLVLNIILQCLIATLLEYEQGSLRVGLVYIIGGFAGSLGTSILDPDLSMVGASAGIYALLISHVPHIVLNSQSLKYQTYRVVSVCSLCIGDVVYNALHLPLPSEPVISWSAHLSGALSGLLAGFLIYTSHNKEISTLIIFIKYFVCIFVIILVLCLLSIYLNYN